MAGASQHDQRVQSHPGIHALSTGRTPVDEVVAQRDCFLTLITVDSQGTPTLLLPNRWQPRAFVRRGWRAVRFNFRGVGASEGGWDEGRGEVDDLLAVVGAAAPAGEALALAGFSFGAFVVAQAVARLHPGAEPPHALAREIAHLVLAGIAVTRFDAAPIPADLHERTLVVHGELDETVPLAGVLDWARPQSLPVTVLPGGEHFFHGQLPLLKTLVERHVRD